MGILTHIETDTGANANIATATATAIGTYTASGDKLVMCDVSIDAVAGNGDYVMYLTRQIGGAGSAYILLPKTTMAAASGETAIAAQSGWITVRNGDVLTVYVDGLAGDTTTPDWSTRWFEMAGVLPAIPTDWLTADGVKADAVTKIQNGLALADQFDFSAITVVSSVVGSTLTILRGDTWDDAHLLGLGDLTDYVSLDFIVKHSRSDPDTDAIIHIRKNATGVGDGLLTLNGVAHTTGTDGSITIDDLSTGDITPVLKATVTDDLIPSNCIYDVQKITATSVKTRTAGKLIITSDVTRAVV